MAQPSPVDGAGGDDSAIFPVPSHAPLPAGLDLDSDLDAVWRTTDTPVVAAGPEVTILAPAPLAGLGGGAGRRATVAVPGPGTPGDGPGLPAASGARPATVGSTGRRPAIEPVPESIWTNEPRDLVGLGPVAIPAIYAEAERRAHGPKWRRLDVKPGNAAVIGLISVVSLILLGMFMSVRARNEVPTDVSQPRPSGDQLQVTRPLNTVPLTTTATTTPAPAPAINLSDLLPTTETTTPAGSTGAGSGPATGAGGGPATTAPATTAAPRTTPSGSAGTTTPATQPPTTDPPTTEPTAPPVTSPPVDNTSPPTTQRTTTSFTLPTYTIPTIPTTPTSRAGPRFPFPDFSE